MATIYEGTEREQDLIDERIDPEILRALGLGDVVDLDYDEYKTLLKERLAANRFNTDQKSREDSAELDEKILKEFKRVRAETGRFRVKNDRVSYQKMLPGNQGNGRGGAIVPKISYMGKPPGEAGEDSVKQDMDLNTFLQDVVAPSLSRIEASLLTILENLSGQQKAEEKTADKARVAGEKAKKREKETKFEGLGLDKIGGVAKKVLSPVTDTFDMIFNFLKNILVGFLALKLFDIFKDPGKFFRDIGNDFIGFLNKMIEGVGNILFLPFNAMIDGINSGLNQFEEAINSTIAKIPGIDEIDLPEIPNLTPPQIPLIPEPPPEPESVPTFAGGGQVSDTTGQRVSGAGRDTQLVALQPGEFVMSKSAVDSIGLDTMMAMNAMGGGTNSPKTAKVQSSGGEVFAMQGGGSVPIRSGVRGRGAKATMQSQGGTTPVQPKQTVTGKSPGGSGGGSWKPILELIAKHEAVGGSYDSIYPSSKKQGLSQMTIAEADAWQASTANSRGSAAAGRYQFMYIKNQAAAAGIGPNELFSPENQDKMAIALIEGKRGITMDMMKNNPDEAMIRLGKEWASLPMPRAMQGASRMVSAGQSYYAGDGRNKAGATVNEVRQAMGVSQTMKPSESTPQTSQTQSSSAPAAPGSVDLPENYQKPQYQGGDLPMVSPTRQDPPRPPSRGGGTNAQVPVLAASTQQSSSASSGDGGSTAPMFSALDMGNPELIVVKSIYNIVG